MAALVTEIRKCNDYGTEKPFAVVRFKRTNEKGSKFAVGSLNDGGSYSLTYNLQHIYPEMLTDEGKFKANKAFETFCNELPIGSTEDVNLYDIPISEISELEAVKVVATGRTMQVMRPACYGERADAIRIARASLERQLREKTFVPVTDSDEEEEEEDD